MGGARGAADADEGDGVLDAARREGGCSVLAECSSLSWSCAMVWFGTVACTKAGGLSEGFSPFIARIGISSDLFLPLSWFFPFLPLTWFFPFLPFVWFLLFLWFFPLVFPLGSSLGSVGVVGVAV